MRTRIAARGLALVLVLCLLPIAGCSMSGFSGSNSGSAVSSKADLAPTPATPPSGASAGRATDSGSTSDSAQSGGAAVTQQMIVTTAAMQLRVSDITAAVASIRGFASEANGTISDLEVSSDSESPAPPTPQASGAKLPGPASASLTLRIPAARVTGVEAKIAGLGELVSQSSNQSDVTQQHIDMSARLANLRAEEARLRTLLDRAGKVSDLLEVERELSRVRGDIESMAAQLSYLENQAALATLTIKLDQPGPIVRPSDGGWGFGDALTQGIQGAVGLVKVLLTMVIALSPLLAIGAVIWWLAALAVRRRRRKHAAQMAEQAQPAPAEQPEPPSAQARE